MHSIHSKSLWIPTERRGWVVNNFTSYSGGPFSNFGPETGYPDWRFSWFFSVPPDECQDSTLN
jgi:hypothetical protein